MEWCHRSVQWIAAKKQCPVMEAVNRYNGTLKDNVATDCSCQPDSLLLRLTERYRCNPSRWAQTAADWIRHGQLCLNKDPEWMVHVHLYMGMGYRWYQATEHPCRDASPCKGPSSCHGLKYFREWEWQWTLNPKCKYDHHQWCMQWSPGGK